MDFKTLLLKEHSKANAQYISDLVGDDTILFNELIDLIYHTEDQIAQRAAHAASHCFDKSPYLIVSHILKMIDYLDTNPAVAVKRNIVRMLQKQAIPESHQGKLVNHCFNYILDAKETVAVKVFSMTILTHICNSYPELSSEVSLVIHDLLQNNPTPGIRSRGKKLLKQLSKISNQ